MSHNDDHIWELLEVDTSEISHLFVGLHNPDGESARKIIERAELIKSRRASNGGPLLQLHFYDAASAVVWRDSDAESP